MSYSVARFAILGMLLSLSMLGSTLSAAAADAEHTTRLDTYVTPDGAGYFALRLVPNVALTAGASRDVVVLFGTPEAQEHAEAVLLAG